MFFTARKKYKLLPDSALVTAYKLNGDKYVFEELYIRYVHLVLGTCLKYLKDENKAQDLTSEIFEELGSKIRKHEIEYFKGWLYRLVKNKCLMLLRKNQYLFIHSTFIENIEGFDYDAEQKERKIQLMEEAIQHLNQEQSDCILLFYLEDKSYLEISTELKIEIKTVKSYIQNGKRNLKNLLIQHEEFQEK